ncbi:hypothetical protein XENOCAPTIV_005329 [Xenoophorus captivus]|uniref:Ig-like domain-containing protein n=1 Tax=Xenoophorus captivus TaxID=1517983 RepID=A0ABV0RLW2_9TELE
MTEIKKKDKKGKKKGGKKGQKEKEGDPATAAAPKLKPIKNPIIVGEGNKLTVKCEATGNPVPTYRWFKDGNELKKSRKVKIKSNLKFSRVQISSAKLEDSGNYTCVVENPLGKDNSTGTVNVQGSEYRLQSNGWSGADVLVLLLLRLFSCQLRDLTEPSQTGMQGC